VKARADAIIRHDDFGALGVQPVPSGKGLWSAHPPFATGPDAPRARIGRCRVARTLPSGQIANGGRGTRGPRLARRTAGAWVSSPATREAGVAPLGNGLAKAGVDAAFISLTCKGMELI
jgi:hypothetical protein